MNETQLTPLSQVTQWERSYVIRLCEKGFVAHKTDGINYLVSVDDIKYHIRQVQLLRMTPANFNISLTVYNAKKLGLDAKFINTTILKPRKVARSRKHA